MTPGQLESYFAQINLPFDWSLLPSEAYLVGGSVRDALLGRYKNPIDLDFVLPSQAIATARDIANLSGGGFVVLDEARKIARVVFPGGTLDLAQQEGDSIENDLQRRDYTLNAIAYNWQRQEILDPLGGLQDLSEGILRMVSPQNLEDDPLRLLRAYRQAAQLNLLIEPDTQQSISQRSNLLQQVAAERVQAELNYLLSTPQGHQWATQAIDDSLFQFWLPQLNQSNLAQLNSLNHGLEFCQIHGLEYPELILLARLSTLVSLNPARAEQELAQLKYSRAHIKAITKTLKHLPYLKQLSSPMSLREQYFWFLEVKDVFPLLIARAIAAGVSSTVILPLIKRYQDPNDQITHPQCLVTGHDLIQQLQLKPSPIIGELLTQIQVAQIEAKVSTPQQALALAKSIIQSRSLAAQTTSGQSRD